MSGTSEPLVLTWVEFADVADFVNGDGVVEPHFVMHSCDHAVKAYYCVRCQAQLANVGNLVMHLENGGTHHVAVWCTRHRVFEAPEQSMVDGFEQAMVQRSAP